MSDTAARVLRAFRASGLRLVTAESCTGGLIAASLTALAGSSEVVEGGFVTYSNNMKRSALGVPEALLAVQGAVSAEVARAMAEGALARSEAARAIAVTGIAGPGGGSEAKPVGLVWFGLARPGMPAHAEQRLFPGDRAEIRAATVAHALTLLLASI